MRTLVLATVSIFSLACSDSSGPGSITGMYTLRTVNGAPLPYMNWQFSDQYGRSTQEILADSIRLDAAGQCTWTTTYRDTDNGVARTGTYPVPCAWALAGSTISICPRPTSASECYYPPQSGPIGGGTMTIRWEDGTLFVYRK
jgi:hypothetical protein